MTIDGMYIDVTSLPAWYAAYIDYYGLDLSVVDSLPDKISMGWGDTVQVPVNLQVCL